MALIKRKILISRVVLYTTSCTLNYSVLFCRILQKRGFPKYGFFPLKIQCQLDKKIDTACYVKIIVQVSADEGMGN